MKIAFLGEIMNIKQINSNLSEITLGNGNKVLFSYETPVASLEDGQFYKTDKFWSKTTSRHINSWVHLAIEKSQEYFYNLVKGV
jgi:hypothetical protein